MAKDIGKILPFPGSESEIDIGSIDLDALDTNQLIALKDKLTLKYDELQEVEFDDPESPECFKWLTRISEIEDILDEIDEMLET